MSYTPTDWKTGDVVTSAKLNNIENGISNAEPFIVTISPESNDNSISENECDKTIAEIFDAFDSNKNIYLRIYSEDEGSVYITRLNLSDIEIANGERILTFNHCALYGSMLTSICIYFYEKQKHISVNAHSIQLEVPENPSDPEDPIDIPAV